MWLIGAFALGIVVGYAAARLKDALDIINYDQHM